MDIQGAARKAGRKVGRMLSTVEQPDADILDLLRKDHDEVEDLLDKLVESQNGAERKSLLRKIKGALVPHVRAEEKIVYDAVMAVKGKKEAQDGEEGYLEHGLADRMLATLGKISGAM